MTSIAFTDGTGLSRVLVLHGWFLDSDVWSKARPATDRTTYTYGYVDFPGYGVNRPAASAQGLDGMVEAAVAAADELGWDRFSVLGHSMGGATALLLAGRHPDRVESVVALTPAAPAGSQLDDATYKVFEDAWAAPADTIQGALSPHMTRQDALQIERRNREVMDQDVWKQYLANWALGASTDPLGSVKAPTTILWGESDGFVSDTYLKATVDLVPGAQLVKVPGGHYPMVEHPQASVEAWEKALAQR